MKPIEAALAVMLAAASAFAQAPDRAAAPRPGPAPALKLPAIQKHALSNGLAVWIVESHEVPVAQVTMVLRSGAASDPPARSGLASLTGAMLDEGAGGLDALGIADTLDYLGAELTTSSSFDASFVSLHVPVARLAETLAVMADVVMRPAFAEPDLNRLREERLTGLKQARDNPAAVAGIVFPLVVFGASHRYGIAAGGTGETLQSFSTEDLRRFHAGHYQPANAAIVAVGDVTAAALLPALEREFGGWKAPAAPAAHRAVTDAPQVKARHVYLVDRPGAAQSQIRIGWVGVPRSTPDYHAIEVLNTILGGSFTSRLNQNLREQHGYTYGASSTFDMRRAAGPFFAGAGVQTDKTAEALTEFFKELTGIREPVSAGELEKAKNYVALRFPRRFETTRGIAGQLAQMIEYGLPDDFFATYVQKVQAVTAQDLARAASTYIQPDRFAVVVVGDRKVFEEKIRALHLGPVTVLKAEDVVR